MTYPFKGKDGCAVSGVAVTPSDSTVIPFDALYVGVAGNITVTGADGVDVVFSNVAVGFFPVGGTKVKAATTATNIVALKI